MNMPIVGRTDAPTGFVTNNRAESVAVGTGPTGRTWPMTREKLGRAG